MQKIKRKQRERKVYKELNLRYYYFYVYYGFINYKAIRHAFNRLNLKRERNREREKFKKFIYVIQNFPEKLKKRKKEQIYINILALNIYISLAVDSIQFDSVICRQRQRTVWGPLYIYICVDKSAE